MPSSVAAAWSSKSNVRQNFLRSARPHARLIRPPSGEWRTSCMPPASSKNRSATRRLRRGRAPRADARGRHVRDHLVGGGRLEAGLGAHPRGDRVGGVTAAEALVELAAQVRDLVGQLARARRGLAEPERDRRRLAVRVLDEHLARLDAADLPRGVAELEDVARGAVDREVLVDLADLGLVGELHHRVVVVVGDRAAAHDRREPGAAPRAHHAGHAIAVDVRAHAAAPVRDALGEHLEDLLELRLRHHRVGRCAADHARSSSASGRSSPAAAATICCARMSSGASRMVIRSRLPRRTPRTSAAHSTS